MLKSGQGWGCCTLVPQLLAISPRQQKQNHHPTIHSPWGGVGAYPSFQGARCGVHPEQVPRMSQGLFTHKPLVFLGPSEVAVLLLLQCDWSLICSFRINAKCCHEVLFNNFLHFFFSQNENLRSSRDAPHSSSMSDMAISPLSLFSPVSPTDSVFWDSVETPPKVSIICF